MADKNDQIAYQREYYEARFKPNMQPAESAYTLQHINNVIRYADLLHAHSILEVGAGLGRCSLPLLARGYKLTCTDISPYMLDGIKAKANDPSLRTQVVDITEAGLHLKEKFDRVIGFFTLHHMHNIEGCFRGAASVAKPGAVVAFCEPVAFNPLYYLQIAFTKDMTWEAEKGIVHMHKGYVFPAMKKAGLTDLRCVSYGFFPPFIVNKPWGKKTEELLEKARIFGWAHAFQIFAGRMPG